MAMHLVYHGKVVVRWLLIASLGLFMLFGRPAPVHADGVLFVAPTATGGANCSSWENACSLQTALTNAITGNQVWVKAGVYTPGTLITDTIALKSGVGVYGGFAGNETALSNRDPVSNVTILSGDIHGDDTNLDGNFIAETPADIQGENSDHIVTADHVADTATLDGFVITAGQSIQGFGGMNNNFSNPVLTNLTFSGNSGSAMYNYNSSPSLTTVIFAHNSTPFDGGGMENYGNSSPTLTDVTFTGNHADYYGGGMSNQNYSNPTLTNVTFTGNTANDGGGIAQRDNSNPTLANVTFDNNSATLFGGGMRNKASSPTLTNITFRNNSAQFGGGMDSSDQSRPVLIGVIFDSNSAKSGGGMLNRSSNSTMYDVIFSSNSASNGGGMINYESLGAMDGLIFIDNTASTSGGGMENSMASDITLTNTTFYSNTAGTEGGGLVNFSSHPIIVNVAFYGNTATNGGGVFNHGGRPTLTNVVFSGNSATYGGGLTNQLYCNLTLVNATFSYNTAIDGGGIYNREGSNPNLSNVILWGNTASSHPQIYRETGDPVIAYSLIQGSGGSGAGWDATLGIDGGHNLDVNPLFADPDGADNTFGTLDDDLRLQSGSPVIDAGDNDAVPTGVVTDLDRNPRFLDIPSVIDTGHGAPPIVDMGAYEAYPPTFTSQPVIDATEDLPYTYTILAFGGSNKPITITASTLPGWLALTDHGDGTAVLSGRPESTDVGDHPVVLQAINSKSQTAIQSFTITVAPKSPPAIYLPIVVRNNS